MNSRAKGQRGERELADFLTAAGFPARRGQQFAGGQDSPDVVCPGLPFHIEAKRTERLNLDAACTQAERDAGGRKPWAVFHRRNRTGWRVTLDAAAFLAILRETPDDIFELVNRRLATGRPIYGYASNAASGEMAAHYSVRQAPNGQPSNLTPELQGLARSDAFKAWGGDWEALGHQQFLNGPPVVALAGGEFQKVEGQSLIERVAAWFEAQHQGKAVHPVIGEVALNKRGVSDSLAHGIGRDKADAFAAVPEVIAKGRVVEEQKNWKGRGYDSFTIAAPIQIAGKDFVAAVVVMRQQGQQRFYLHEVGLKEKLQQSGAFKSGASATVKAAVEPSGAPSDGAIKTLLRGIFAVNPSSVTVQTDQNGEPLASEVDRFREETGAETYSISSQAQIARVNAALAGMNRAPEARAKQAQSRPRESAGAVSTSPDDKNAATGRLTQKTSIPDP